MEFIVKHTDGTQTNLVSRERASVVTSAKLKQTIMQEDLVQIEVQSARPLDIAIGDTLNVFGKTYTINQLPTTKRTGAGYSTSLTFEGLQYGLIDKLFFPPQLDGVRGDSLCFDLRHMVEIVIENANRGRATKPYVLKDCPADTEYNNMTFTDCNCLKALQDICNQWSVEFALEETTTTIEVTIAEKIGEADTASVYAYGKGAGIYDLQRTKPSEDIITRLYVYGGSDNLTYYRHTKLCMPGKDRWQSYIEDSAMVSRYGLREGMHTFDDIVPQFTGRVTALGSTYKAFRYEQKTWNATTKEWEWGPANFDLNKKWSADEYDEWLALRGIADSVQNRRIFTDDMVGKATKYLIAGTTATIHFQTGSLAGYDIDIEKAITATGIANTEIHLNPLVDENGYDFPSQTNNAFKIAVGDEFIMLGINLPDEWKTQAEEELEAKARDYYEENCNVRATYTLQIEPLWLKRNRGTGAGEYDIFKVGNSIQILDVEGGLTEPTGIRINSLERDLLNVYNYRLTLNDSVELRAITRMVGAVAQIEQVVAMNDLSDPNQRRKNWNIKREVLDNVFDTDGYFQDRIRPLSIETQMIAVGARSQQFTISNMVMTPNVPDSSNTPQPEVCAWTSGLLSHYTINGDDTTREWDIASGRVSSLPRTALYVYARCAKATGSRNASIVIDNAKRQFDADPTDYYFLIGTMSSVDSETNSRKISLTYGFTTISGNDITTGRIESNDGKTYFDLNSGKICGDIVFNTSSGEKEVDAYVQGLVDKGVQDATKDIDAQVETLVDGKVSNIEIGGRNYCRESHGDSLKYLQILNYAGVTLQTLDNVPCLQFDASSTARGFFIDAGKISSAYDRSSHPWSLAIDVLVENANTNFLIGLEGRKTNTVTVKSANTWTRLKISGNSTFGTIVVYKTTSGKAYVKNWKLETGTNATDWTAATEDVNESISSAQTAANEATETANGASTTANAAKNAVDNFSIGGRNLLRNTGEKNMTIPASAFTEYNYTTTIQFPTIAEGMTICGQYKVDGWTNSFPPIPSCILGKGDGDAWSRRLYFSTYKTIGSNTRLYQASAVIKTTDANILNVGGSKIVKILAERGDGKAYSFTAYDIKVEIGSKPTDYSPAPEDTDAAILAAEQKAMMADYLRNAIQDGSTTVKGGLILTQMIGVGAGDATTAGMNGGSGDNPIRFWAGSTSFGDAMSAPFQVYDDGRVVMNMAEIGSLNSLGYGISIRNGKIEIKRGGSPLTQILPDMATSISSALADMAAAANGSIPNVNARYSPAEKSVSGGPSSYGTDYKQTASWSEDKYFEGVIFAAADYTGTATIKSNVTFSATMPGYSLVRDSNPGWTLQTYSNSRSMSMAWYLYENYGMTGAKIIQQGSGTISTSGSTITASLNGVTFNVTTGRKYSLVVKLTFTASVVLYATKTGSYYGGWSAQITWTTGGTTNTTADLYNSAEAYKNKYYADGFVLSKASDNYMAYVPTAGAYGEVWRLRQGNFVMSLTGGKLGVNMYGNEGIYYNLMNVAVAGVITWNSGSPRWQSTCNTYNKAVSVAAVSGDTSRATLTHNLNDGGVIVHAIAYNNGNYTYQVQNVQSITANSCIIKVSDYRVYQVQVIIFKFN